MTDKLTLTDAATFDNSIINVINANNDAIITAVDNTLSRDGSTPNQMQASLDMNSYPIMNLPAPGSANSPARLIDVTSTNPISISLSLEGDVTAAASSGVLDTTVAGIKGYQVGVATPYDGGLLVGNGLGWNAVLAQGDVGILSTGATYIPAGRVTGTMIASGAIDFSKIGALPTHTVMGNSTSGSATPTALTTTQLTTLINSFTSSLSGATPASGGGTTNFLRADGTWALPPSAQTFQLLNTLTASSSANLADTTSFTSSYTTYEVILDNIAPGTINGVLKLLLHSGGSYKSTAYTNLWNAVDGTNTTGVVDTSITTYIPVTSAISSDFNATNVPGCSGRIRFYNPSSASYMMVDGILSYYGTALGLRTVRFTSYWTTSAVIDGFQLVMTSGTIASGKVKIYGIA